MFAGCRKCAGCLQLHIQAELSDGIHLIPDGCDGMHLYCCNQEHPVACQHTLLLPFTSQCTACHPYSSATAQASTTHRAPPLPQRDLQMLGNHEAYSLPLYHTLVRPSRAASVVQSYHWAQLWSLDSRRVENSLGSTGHSGSRVTFPRHRSGPLCTLHVNA